MIREKPTGPRKTTTRGKREAGRRTTPWNQMRLVTAALCVVVPVVLGLHGCGPSEFAPDVGEEPIAGTQATRSEAWEEMERAEKLIRDLGSRLSAMSRSVLNLQLPDDKGRQLLARSIAYRDIAGEEPSGGRTLDQLEVKERQWPLAEKEQRAAPADLRLWDPLLRQVDYFHHVKFKLAQGEFRAADVFDSDVKFSGLARLKSGRLSWVRSKLTLRWHLKPTEDDEEDWRITEPGEQHPRISDQLVRQLDESLGRGRRGKSN